MIGIKHDDNYCIIINYSLSPYDCVRDNENWKIQIPNEDAIKLRDLLLKEFPLEEKV